MTVELPLDDLVYVCQAFKVPLIDRIGLGVKALNLRHVLALSYVERLPVRRPSEFGVRGNSGLFRGDLLSPEFEPPFLLKHMNGRLLIGGLQTHFSGEIQSLPLRAQKGRFRRPETLCACGRTRRL